MLQQLTKDPASGLYPAIQPYRTTRLKVSSIHEVYVEESGNPKGKPVIFCHGGPGGATEEKHRQLFNPQVYRIILFDQRGCGKSTPYACLDNNTTWDLVADMEKIRTELQIDKWQVFGGSWGSTLALSYAETHPERVSELVLRGIFLLRKSEIDWFYQEGASWIYPDAWENYLHFIPENERTDLVMAYHRRIMSPDKAVALKACKEWSLWEGKTSKLLPDSEFIDGYGTDEFALAFARIESHFFVNRGFFKEDDWLLQNANKLKNIPGVIVQGRYDVVCPMRSAWDLHRAWPQAEMVIVPDAGHSAFEKGISKALVAATDRFAL
ncbi:MAG: prolyl aminopeptidase [Proteobacteria bacterium]|nr:prolyl aminopeptidase [Pseudomonadota bacterium]